MGSRSWSCGQFKAWGRTIADTHHACTVYCLLAGNVSGVTAKPAHVHHTA
jgi:hypothetical protein